MIFTSSIKEENELFDVELLVQIISNCIRNSKCMSSSIFFVLKHLKISVHFLTYLCIFIKLQPVSFACDAFIYSYFCEKVNFMIPQIQTFFSRSIYILCLFHFILLCLITVYSLFGSHLIFAIEQYLQFVDFVFSLQNQS